MGKHFDTLVDIVKTRIRDTDSSNDVYDTKNRIPNIKQYLLDIIQRASLVELPINAEELLVRSGQVKRTYSKKISDYFDLSEKLGCHIHLPFEVTAIEDRESVVVVEHLYGVTCRVSGGREDLFEERKYISFFIGEVDFSKPKQFPKLFPVLPLYCFLIENGERKPDKFFLDLKIRKWVADDVISSAVSYTEQLVYIMDPENMLLEKQKIDQTGKDVTGLEKTNRKVHYLCVNFTDALELLGEKKQSIYIPTEGPERFLYNQRTLIEKIVAGNGRTITPDGWHLRLMVKESPTRIVPYK